MYLGGGVLSSDIAGLTKQSNDYLIIKVELYM